MRPVGTVISGQNRIDDAGAATEPDPEDPMDRLHLSLWAMRRTYLISMGTALLLLSTVATGLYLGLQTQERFRKVSTSWGVFTEQTDRKGLWLSEIRGHLGYGGIIHDFKNYVLRRDEYYADAVKQRLSTVYLSIDSYLGYVHGPHHCLRHGARNRPNEATMPGVVPVIEFAAGRAFRFPRDALEPDG